MQHSRQCRFRLTCDCNTRHKRVSCCEDRHNNGNNHGGYYPGNNNGYNDYNNGYNNGYNDYGNDYGGGYNEGFNDGYNAASDNNYNRPQYRNHHYNDRNRKCDRNGYCRDIGK